MQELEHLSLAHVPAAAPLCLFSSCRLVRAPHGSTSRLNLDRGWDLSRLGFLVAKDSDLFGSFLVVSEKHELPLALH